MTRQNLCPNPALKNNATGYSGTSSPARLTGLTGLPRTTGAGPAGGGYVQSPNGACAPGDVMTVSFYVKNNTAFVQTGKTCFVSYTRSAGGDVFPESFTYTGGAVGAVSRASFTTAAAPALATNIYLVVDSLVAGFELTAFQYEKVGALDTYFDGDTAGAAWDGTDGNSTSTLGAVVPTAVFADFVLSWQVVNAVSRDFVLAWQVGDTVDVHPHPAVRVIANFAAPTARYVDEHRVTAYIEAGVTT